VIFGSDRAKFGTPDTALRGKRVCVTGQIRDYRGKPEIILNDPGQLGE
jgi:DNA/RNA endonuclease YhcR with UshA esterase domain